MTNSTSELTNFHSTRPNSPYYNRPLLKFRTLAEWEECHRYTSSINRRILLSEHPDMSLVHLRNYLQDSMFQYI